MISLVNMYIPCFLQVVCPYLKIIKNEKRVKSPKRKIKGLEKKNIKKNIKNGPQTQERDKNKT